MGQKSEALAKQFEAKARDAMNTLEHLSAADWKKVTAAEQWSVGVTAHHLAAALGPIAGMIQAVSAGKSPTGFDLSKIEMNAKHVRDHEDRTRAETIDLHRKGVATAAATIRGLTDEQLAKSAPLMPGALPMTAEELITLGLLNHIDEHFGSIRRTVGHPDGGKER